MNNMFNDAKPFLFDWAPHISVIRFSNDEIFTVMDEVAQYVEKVIGILIGKQNLPPL